MAISRTHYGSPNYAGIQVWIILNILDVTLKSNYFTFIVLCVCNSTKTETRQCYI